MEIENLGDIAILAEIMSALAVVITLGYLAIQIKQSNKHAMLESIQHTWSSLNEYCDQIAQSEELTSIVLRGRNSLKDLYENEKERFTHIHMRLLNTIECWLMMIIESYPKGVLRDQHLRNLDGIVSGYFDYPGTLELWESFNPSWSMPELKQLLVKNTDYGNEPKEQI
jgi:hypothetical protein